MGSASGISMRIITGIVFIIFFNKLNDCYSKDSDLLQPGFCLEQTSTNKDTTLITNRETFYKEFLSNISIQAHAPFNMNKKEAIYVFGVVGITATLILLDQSIDNSIRQINRKNITIGNASKYVTELGGNYGFGLCAAFAGFSFLRNSEREMQTTRLLTQSLLTVTVWTRLIKFLAGRERPLYLYELKGYDNDDPSQWSGPTQLINKRYSFFPGSRYDSFLSGHTATAFAIATVFATQYKDYPVVPVIAYSLATVVGFTRMTEHEHWASDVFAGACLGYLCAKQVCRHAKNSENKHRDVQCYIDYMNHSLVGVCSLKF